MTDLCVICVRDANNKAKPGILPCLGCKQKFCTQHVVLHRQELANELDLVIGERNELQEMFDHCEHLPDTSLQKTVIDEWVQKTIEQVHQVAEEALQRLAKIAEEHRLSVRDQCTELSKQLNDIRENENFHEQDIVNLRDKCNHLKTVFNQVTINVNTTDVTSSLNGAITCKQAEQVTVDYQSYVEGLMTHQTPYKQIKLPHGGQLFVENGIALINNRDNYTMINLEDNSMRSISSDAIGLNTICWSSYLNAYLSKNGSSLNIIKFTPIPITSCEQNITFDTKGRIMNIACFTDRLLIVRDCGYAETVIEQWSLSGTIDNDRKPSVKFVARWRPPLSCTTNEFIGKIAFNSKHIVLTIRNRTPPKRERIEFRTRGMVVLRQVELTDDVDFSSLFFLSMKDGWILGQKRRNKPRQYTLIDDDLHEHEQKLLSTKDIESIAVFIYPSQKQTLAIYRENHGAHELKNGNYRFVLDLYKIQ